MLILRQPVLSLVFINIFFLYHLALSNFNWTKSLINPVMEPISNRFPPHAHISTHLIQISLIRLNLKTYERSDSHITDAKIKRVGNPKKLGEPLFILGSSRAIRQYKSVWKASFDIAVLYYLCIVKKLLLP